jgi:adenosylhomocysteine nucleosidase
MRLKKLGVFICISALFSCNSCRSTFVGRHSEPITAILGALDEEVTMLQEQMANKAEKKIEGLEFVTGTLKGRKVVIAATGIAKVNAAMTTTLLIEHFKPNEVIFTGIAGGINPKLLPGDIVIGQKTVQHDLGILTPAGLENEGSPNPIDGEQNPVFFTADGRLLGLAWLAAENIELEKINTDSGQRQPKVIKGVIVTGDVFAASTAKRTELLDRLDADAIEMEGGAVAQICHQQKVPHLIVRGISDMADEHSLEDIDIYLEIAAKNSATLASKIIELLASREIN